MKLLSWNVNGIRAIERKQADKWMWDKGYDVIALQETKSHPEQLSEYLLRQSGYEVFFDSAEIRKGYSGTALYVKQSPNEVIKGLPDAGFTDQGRLLTAVYDDYVICNGYFPNGGSKTSNLDYKLKFYNAFLDHVNAFVEDGYKVIFGGDLNVAHTEIDLARPKANEKNTGFLPIERAWVNKVIQSGYLDVFRTLNPKKTDVYTYWDMKSSARERNVGWRIDYWFVSDTLKDSLIEFKTLSNIDGSDHCPIVLDVSL